MTAVEGLAGLSDKELLDALEKLADHHKYNRLDFYQPYPKQKAFFDLGATKQERMLFAGNQMGKSYAGAAETAMHLTGLYPDWWTGRRFDRPVRAWAAGVSTTSQRDIAQTLLCGEPEVEEMHGTGFVPRHCFSRKPTLARGSVAGAYDTIFVKHFDKNGVQDGISTLQFKSYEQGREKFQGRTLDFVWWDEEPPMPVYTEGNARWSATGGMSFMTFTPLFGYSDVVCLFLHATAADMERRGHVTMGFKDSLHMTEEKVKDALAKYPKHEHDARMNGVPLLGSGKIFTVDDTLVRFKRSLPIPVEFAKLWGIDFGITHPFAAVLIAWDREMDVIHVLTGYRASNQIPIVHAEAMRHIAADVPVAWPHDGHQRDKGSGEELAKQYKSAGLKMLPTHAHYPTGGFSTEAVVMEVEQRLMKAGGPGGMVIREDFDDLFDEIRMYHRKDGLIVKERDDLLSALFKAVMMRRFARPGALGFRPHPVPGQAFANRPTAATPIDPHTGLPVYA